MVTKFIKPPLLKKGDTIAVVSTSGGLSAHVPHRVEAGKKALEALGFKVLLTESIYATGDRGRAGDATFRANQIMQCFTNIEVKAIIASIGGLFLNEVLPLLDYNVIAQHPKIFCGYSDNTLLHQALLTQSSLISFYGPCLTTQFGEYPAPLDYTVRHFLSALTQSEPIGAITPSIQWTDEVLDWFKKDDLKRPRNLVRGMDSFDWIKPGKASGPINGGCLYSLLQLRGTPFAATFKDSIFFFEIPEGDDFRKGTRLSMVESQIIDLKNSGFMSQIRGLIIGRGYGYSEKERQELREIVVYQIKDCSYPVLFNVDIGHSDPMLTVPLGVTVELDSARNIFAFTEAGVK